MVLWQCEAPHSLEAQSPVCSSSEDSGRLQDFWQESFQYQKNLGAFMNYTLMAQRCPLVSEFWALSSGTRDKDRK